MANPIDQTMRREIKSTINGRIMETIERHRRNRKTVNPLANSKVHQTVDEKLLEFVEHPDQVDAKLYQLHDRFKKVD